MSTADAAPAGKAWHATESPGRGASVPPYLRAAADLRRQILSGRLGPGERLPFVRTLPHSSPWPRRHHALPACETGRTPLAALEG
ncbi:GntR family transcriptional regulator [Streptomyces sp. WAC04114]|nr:GntR family transcriptional regulator [Streptomyces sp. WAC04114]